MTVQLLIVMHACSGRPASGCQHGAVGFRPLARRAAQQRLHPPCKGVQLVLNPNWRCLSAAAC